MSSPTRQQSPGPKEGRRPDGSARTDHRAKPTARSPTPQTAEQTAPRRYPPMARPWRRLAPVRRRRMPKWRQRSRRGSPGARTWATPGRLARGPRCRDRGGHRRPAGQEKGRQSRSVVPLAAIRRYRVSRRPRRGKRSADRAERRVVGHRARPGTTGAVLVASLSSYGPPPGTLLRQIRATTACRAITRSRSSLVGLRPGRRVRPGTGGGSVAADPPGRRRCHRGTG